MSRNVKCGMQTDCECHHIVFEILFYVSHYKVFLQGGGLGLCVTDTFMKINVSSAEKYNNWEDGHHLF